MRDNHRDRRRQRDSHAHIHRSVVRRQRGRRLPRPRGSPLPIRRPDEPPARAPPKTVCTHDGTAAHWRPVIAIKTTSTVPTITYALLHCSTGIVSPTSNGGVIYSFIVELPVATRLCPA